MLWRGIAIGIIISAPMGPVGILCVQRTLDKGRKSGFFTGVGASISDLFYCLLTGFGLSFIEDFLKANQDVIQIVGSVVLMVFGVYLFKSNPARGLKKPEEIKVSKRKSILSGFLFTFSNPLIIFLIIGLFTRFNFLLPEITFFHYIIGFMAIIGGALIWWWVVTLFVDKVRSHFNLRSMWLINKITGSIIVAFGVVGVVTAVVNIANAAPVSPASLRYEIHCKDAPLLMENAESHPMVKFLPLEKSEDFSFSFRAANLHNEARGKYQYVEDGKIKKVAHPSWSVMLVGKNNHELEFRFRTLNDKFDDVRQPKLMVELFENKEKISEVFLTEGVDFFTDWNSYRLVCDGGRFSLLVGNREYRSCIEANMPFRADSVALMVSPGGGVKFDCMMLAYPAACESLASGSDYAKFALPDVRDSYFSSSRDDLEGEYEIFDMSLKNEYLISGGDYKLALVDDGEKGYCLIYLGGARVNTASWRPGMLKGRLRATSFAGVYDVEWYNPAGITLRGPAKAQWQPDNELFAIRFATHESDLRLRKVK